MHKSFFYLMIFSILSSCSIKKQVVADQVQELNGAPELKIRALNLSEDLSRLSSQNDEILILAYKNQELLSEPVIMEYFLFDEEQKLFNIPLRPGLFNNGELILFMLEIDTELKPSEIEKKVRNHKADLESAFLESDRLAQSAIIGDDDLLGVSRINKETLRSSDIYNFFGTHKLDRYEYELQFLNLEIIE